MPTEAQEARGELLDQTDSSARVSMAEAGAGEERRCTLHLGGGRGFSSFTQQTCTEHLLCARHSTGPQAASRGKLRC